MANLIPPDAKRAIAIEYWLRVITVWFFMIGVAFLVVALLKLPTFVLVQKQLSAFNGAYNDARIKKETFLDTQQTINEANELSNLLSGQGETIEFTKIVDILDSIAGSGVDILNMKFEKTEQILSRISIKGFADTRIDLANFSRDVEGHELFDEAELPISSLAKDKDISFSLEIIPSTQ